MKRILSIAVFCGIACTNFAQKIEGKVTNTQNQALEGISITIAETFIGTTSDAQGKFSIPVKKNGTYTIVVQGVGFTRQTKQVIVKGDQSMDFSLSPAFTTLKEVTVTAGRKAEIVDRTPASVQVINSKEIQTQMQVSANISNVLAQAVPALAFGTNTTSNTGQTLRGRTPLILVDGIPQSTPLRNGSRDIRTIDPATIERIEVVKGATAIYGNGADGGIINYITKKPVRGEKFSAYTSLASTGMLAHSNGTLGARITQQFTGNLEKFDYLVNATYEKTGVNKDANGTVLTPVYGVGESDIYNINLKGGYNITSKQRVEAMYNYFGSAQHTKYIEQTGKFLQTPTIGVEGKHQGEREGTRYNHNAYVKYQAKDIFGKTNLEASTYLQSFYTIYGFSGYFENGGQSTIQSDKKGFRLNMLTPYTANQWFTGDVVYGMDILNDKTGQKLTDGRTWVPKMDLLNTAPYVQATANLFDHWILKAGYRFDHVNIDIPDFTQLRTAAGAGGNFINGGELSFNASTFNTGLRFAKWEIFKPFISYTQGFSIIDVGRYVRSAKENDIARMQIQPVKVNNYEAGFSSSYKWFAVSGSYFISTNKIGASLVEDNGIYVQQKAPEKTYGYELAVDVSPLPSLKFGVSHMYVEGKADINKNNSFDDDVDIYLTGMKITPPKTSAYVNYSFKQKASVQLQWLHYGDRKRFKPRANGRYAYGEGPVDSNSWLNLSSNYKLNKKLNVFLGIENLLNNDFFLPQALWGGQDGDYVKANGIRYQLGVQVNW